VRRARQWLRVCGLRGDFVPNNGEGAVNQGAGHGWTIQYNTVQHNQGAGVFIGSNDVVQYNCLTHNGEYGFNAYEAAGVSNVVLTHNEISYNNTHLGNPPIGLRVRGRR
jgi:hypothetical protein